VFNRGDADTRRIPLGAMVYDDVANCAGARRAGDPHATCDVARAGNQLAVRLVRHSQRKRGTTARPNLRSNGASPRPYRARRNAPKTRRYGERLVGSEARLVTPIKSDCLLRCTSDASRLPARWQALSKINDLANEVECAQIATRRFQHSRTVIQTLPSHIAITML
jgi:hypothetical protein